MYGKQATLRNSHFSRGCLMFWGQYASSKVLLTAVWSCSSPKEATNLDRLRMMDEACSVKRALSFLKQESCFNTFCVLYNGILLVKVYLP